MCVWDSHIMEGTPINRSEFFVEWAQPIVTAATNNYLGSPFGLQCPIAATGLAIFDDKSHGR